MEARYNPLKILRWHDRITATLEGSPTGPIRATMDLTNLCNHACSWCEPLAYREDTIKLKNHTLLADVAIDTIRQMSEMGCEGITFSGGGEPTLHPEFPKILWEAHNRGMRTFVITNGSRLKKYAEPFACHTREFRVSLDASCKEEHAAIHGSKNGGFDEIVESLKFIAKGRAVKGYPRIGVTYTCEPRNFEMESLIRMMALAEHMGIDYLYFRPESSSEIKFEEWWCRSLEEKAARYCPSVEVMVFGWRNSDVLTQREFSKCYSSMIVPVIGANGDVQACCDRRDIVFGNLYAKPFKEIWLSREHRQIAGAIEPAKCVRCLQCGTNKAIESFIVRNDAVVEAW